MSRHVYVACALDDPRPGTLPVVANGRNSELLSISKWLLSTSDEVVHFNSTLPFSVVAEKPLKFTGSGNCNSVVEVPQKVKVPVRLGALAVAPNTRK